MKRLMILKLLAYGVTTYCMESQELSISQPFADALVTKFPNRLNIQNKPSTLKPVSIFLDPFQNIILHSDITQSFSLLDQVYMAHFTHSKTTFHSYSIHGTTNIHITSRPQYHAIFNKVSAKDLEKYCADWDALGFKKEARHAFRYLFDRENLALTFPSDSYDIATSTMSEKCKSLAKKYCFTIKNLLKYDQGYICCANNSIILESANLQSLEGLELLFQDPHQEPLKSLIKTKYNAPVALLNQLALIRAGQNSIEKIILSNNKLRRTDIALLRRYFPKAKTFDFHDNQLQEVRFEETQFGDRLDIRTRYRITKIDITTLAKKDPINIIINNQSLTPEQKNQLIAINKKLKEINHSACQHQLRAQTIITCAAWALGMGIYTYLPTPWIGSLPSLVDTCIKQYSFLVNVVPYMMHYAKNNNGHDLPEIYGKPIKGEEWLSTDRYNGHYLEFR